MTAARFHPLSTVPEPYDIVWCLFPYSEAPEHPGPKPRPAIVRQAFADEEGNPYLKVVYGTTKEPHRHGPCDFTISKTSYMDECGLHKATRFDLSRTAILPWNEAFFPLRPRGLPFCGRLSTHLIKLLQFQIMLCQRATEEPPLAL